MEGSDDPGSTFEGLGNFDKGTTGRFGRVNRSLNSLLSDDSETVMTGWGGRGVVERDLDPLEEPESNEADLVAGGARPEGLGLGVVRGSGSGRATSAGAFACFEGLECAKCAANLDPRDTGGLEELVEWPSCTFAAECSERRLLVLRQYFYQ